MIAEALRGCYAVQLFEARTGLSAAWLVDNVTVTPSDDPDAGPMQWAVDWHGATIDFADLQPAALAALYWQDALADAPFLTDAQRDALVARNLRDEERAKELLDRKSGAHKRAENVAELRKQTRRHIQRALEKEPCLTRPEIYERANQCITERKGIPRSEQTLRIWLLDLLPKAKTGPKRR